MRISDFSYIKYKSSNDMIIKQIEDFYINNNKHNTLKHAKAVAETNVRIAKQYKLNYEKCYLSALLHDVSAVMNPNDMVIYALDRELILDDAEKKYPFLLHQQISVFFAKEIFNIVDVDILSAIACHTTLKSNPSKYDLSLFIADKLSWDQEGKPPFFTVVNNALSSSLEDASLQYIKYMINNNLILYPHKWFIEAKEDLESTCEQNKKFYRKSCRVI